jgi:F-box domain
MARTKQTARKSRGGAAPRTQLAGSRSHLPLYYNYGKRSSHQQIISESSTIPDTVSIPREAISSAAQKTVLSTPDLLVIILSQLPHSSLLKAKRVNRTWASLFGHVEIQAALFQHPRPKGSASYVETHSDILMDRFSTFWPINGEDKAVFSESSPVKTFHPEEWNEIPVDASNSHDPSETRLQNTTTRQPQQQRGHGDKCPYGQQWRQLLICQPPIETLELVQEVNQRVGGNLEFRTVIHRPGGLRMGFLYDAVRHWHEVEVSPVELLWNRRTGDLVYHYQIYVDGPSFKTIEDKPCVTIRGHTSVGCGQYGGLTYANYGSAQRAQVIKSGDEEVEYCMSEPKRMSFDLSLLRDMMNSA